MRKILAMMVVLLLLVVGFAGCGGEEISEPVAPVETEAPEVPETSEAPEEELDELEEEPVEEENPLLTASNEEIQQAVIDALNAADHSTFMEVRSTGTWRDYIVELLGVEPDVIGMQIVMITLQRLDRHGNDVPRGDASEDTFTHWDFIYEVNDEGVLRLFMRQHFDIEADMSGVTRENFDAIETGMSLDDVSSLLGSEGTLGVMSGNHEVRTWSREFGGGTTVIISIYFIDNQVTSKAQVGW